MTPELEREVRRRAAGRCEYCGVPDSAAQTPFQIDHIIALKHRGSTALDNLALACFSCNKHKGPNIAGIDPIGGRLTRLLNPRSDRWSDHLELRPDGQVVGRTDVGRVTVEVLMINDPDRIVLRSLLISEGLLIARAENDY